MYNTDIFNSFRQNSWDILLFKFLMILWLISIPFKNAIYQISFSALDLYFIVHILVTRNFYIIKSIFKNSKMICIGFALLFLSMILSNFLNPEFLSEKSWHHTILFLFRYGVIFLSLSYFYKLNFFTLKELKIGLILGLILLVFIAIFYIINNPNIILDVGKGIAGSLGSRTAFGLFAGLGLVISFTLVEHKVFQRLLIMLFLFFTIFSFARSSWIASFCAINFYLITNKKSITKKDIIFLIILVLFVFGLYFYFNSFQERFNELVKLNSSHRIDIWTYSINMIQKHPLFGYGVDSFRQLPDNPSLISSVMNSTHNMMLEVLLYLGIFGTFFYFLIIITILLQVIKFKNYHILTIFIYMFIVSQFDYGAITSKEQLSYIVIFTFLAFSRNFKENYD